MVVLPAPFGPTIPKISPSSTVNETPSTTFVPRYILTRFSTSMMGIDVSFFAVIDGMLLGCLCSTSEDVSPVERCNRCDDEGEGHPGKQQSHGRNQPVF